MSKVTDAMVEAALMELRRHGIMLTREGTTQAMRAALEAALAVAPKDDPPDEEGGMPSAMVW